MAGDGKPFNNPFGSLAGQRKDLPEGPKPAPETAKKGPARAVVRLERKGRGGKEVTVVEQLALGTRELERWLSELRRKLGCGGTLEGNALVFQGDQRERLRALLESRGVGRVSVG